eukprot:CAMPEP_0185597696 /NCGR_PEP_ID=MMETSP0434-20130131/81534_1 /TAXON_ID=626734 ORGANISM="Favella taraikaensis, Strain Fe Narragansett Bay" /NCGR_SAMPLE_ID=MMETSP0434 /ASSEMBLY_ACC=CAM_ASM_000379 /LENGTH=56 /DNA_ID=CAMNT_0028226497 /DNA_START=136 /DNA_END=306 /DNA_ORIENTATION=-
MHCGLKVVNEYAASGALVRNYQPEDAYGSDRNPESQQHMTSFRKRKVLTSPDGSQQ